MAKAVLSMPMVTVSTIMLKTGTTTVFRTARILISSVRRMVPVHNISMEKCHGTRIQVTRADQVKPESARGMDPALAPAPAMAQVPKDPAKVPVKAIINPTSYLPTPCAKPLPGGVFHFDATGPSSHSSGWSNYPCFYRNNDNESGLQLISQDIYFQKVINNVPGRILIYTHCIYVFLS